MSEKKIRITKANRYEDIKALLNGETPAYNTTLAEAMDFIDHELEMLANKNKNGDREPTETQKQNEVYKKQILDHLAKLPEDSDGVTCTEVLAAIPEIETIHRATALMTQLKNADKVIATKVKGRSMFSLA